MTAVLVISLAALWLVGTLIGIGLCRMAARGDRTVVTQGDGADPLGVPYLRLVS